MTMRVLKNRSVRGAFAVEFVLVMPWFILILAGLIGMTLSLFKAHLTQLKAFGKARKAVVYKADDGRFGNASAPFYPTLKGLRVAWDEKEKMDNPIVFCGDEGECP